MSAFPQKKPEAPPWGREEEWLDINARLARLIGEHDGRLAPVRVRAEEVAADLEWFNAFLDELCQEAFPQCREVCCDANRVWFVFEDLLFFHLTGQETPPAQLRRTLDEACRYLTFSGCSLPRMVRPWTCTWFLCHIQLELLSARPPRFQRRVSAVIGSIIDHRWWMAGEFRRVTGYAG